MASPSPTFNPIPTPIQLFFAADITELYIDYDELLASQQLDQPAKGRVLNGPGKMLGLLLVNS